VSAATHGAGCGAVLGAVLILLLQQFGYLDLTILSNAIVDLVIAIVIGGAIGFGIGLALGKRYLHQHPDLAAP
jgi:hypothetical protein